MEAKHKKILRKNRMSLINDMHIDVLNELVTRQIFKPSEQEKFLGLNGTTARNTAILNNIIHKGPKAFRALAESLFAEAHHLATILIPDLTEDTLYDLSYYEFENDTKQSSVGDKPPVQQSVAEVMKASQLETSKVLQKRGRNWNATRQVLADVSSNTAIQQDKYMEMIYIYVLTPPADHGTYWEFHAFNDKSEYLRGIVSAKNVPFVKKITKDDYKIVTNATLRFKENTQELIIKKGTSKVFQGGNNDFEIPQEKLNKFFTPDEVSIEEAVRSPKRRRVTIQGKVTMIGEKEIGEKITPWQRRDMVLKNTNSTIKLKLWGEKADEITEEHDGATFLFTNVEVDMFKQKPELKTTNLTRLEILSQPPDKSIKVVKQIICGIDPTVEHMVLLTKECKQLICDHEVFKSLSLGVDAFRSLFPVECNITADQQNKVTTITIARH